MADNQNDSEPTGNEELLTESSPKKANAFSGLSRSLTPEEMTSPGAIKLLLDKIDGLLAQNNSLEYDLESSQKDRNCLSDRFHEVDKKAAILQEKIHKETIWEILYGITLTIGAGLIGVSFSEKYWGYAICGAVLMIAGIVVKCLYSKRVEGKEYKQ